jgi:hypothetical protein
VVPREVIEIVKGMLCQPEEVLGLVVMERIGLDGYM